MQPTLLILAAGMASRYGSMKQTQSFGPDGETIMDYSIYDAIRAGFGKVVFIIRKDFADDFKAIFEPKLKGKIATEYVYQEKNSYLPDIEVPADRTKPWGTGHAVLCARDVVKEPFAVINADDFYGKDSFIKAADFLKNVCNEKTYCIIGYELSKTLSEHGTVSRGVCQVDAANNLISIKERTKIYREDSTIVFEEDDVKHSVPNDSSVSMNFWGFHPSLFDTTENLFHSFVKENIANIKSEFFIPIIAEDFMHRLGGEIKVIPTSAQWFGVTYKRCSGSKSQYRPIGCFGEYPASLWK